MAEPMDDAALRDRANAWLQMVGIDPADPTVMSLPHVFMQIRDAARAQERALCEWQTWAWGDLKAFARRVAEENEHLRQELERRST